MTEVWRFNIKQKPYQSEKVNGPCFSVDILFEFVAKQTVEKELYEHTDIWGQRV